MGILQARILECDASPPLGDLPNPGIKLKSPALQVDSLPSEPPRKPKNTGVDSLFFIQGIFLTQELNRGLLYCRRILYQLSYQGSLIGSLHFFFNFLLLFSFFIFSTHTHTHTHTHTKQKPMKLKKKSNLLRPGAYILRTNKGNLQPVKSSGVSKFIH